MEAVVAMINPFTRSENDLISLSSGAMADESTKVDLLDAEKLGEEKLQQFMEDRILRKDTDYFATIKSSKLKTFAASAKKPKKAELMSVRSDRSLFMQLLLVAKERDIDMHNILCYTLSPVPGCFSSLDQTSISKTGKSSLLKHLEGIVPTSLVTERPERCAIAIDAMALIQSLSSSQLPDKFGALGDVLFKRILQIAAQFNASRVDFVGDRYDTMSIKGLERSRRHQTAQVYTISRADQKLPVQWKVFLSSGANKQSLQTFLAQHFKMCKSQTPITLITALQRDVSQLLYEPDKLPTATPVDHLLSDHEEADTRLILHAMDCSRDYDKVVVWSPDTDVAVIGIGHATSMDCNLLFATGTGKHQRLLSLTEIAVNIRSMADVLPAFHALTGCDTTSSFYGKGKKSAFNSVKERPELIDALNSIGNDFSIDELAPGIEELVCAIYNCKNISTVNQARFVIFKSGSSEKALPPTENALEQHVKRANYQAKIWKSALKPMMSCPSPDGNGWIVDDDSNITVTWLTGEYAPKSILKTTSCKCSTTACKTARCKCSKEGLKCTALCGCKNCANQNPNGLPESEDEGGDSDSDIDDL